MYNNILLNILLLFVDEPHLGHSRRLLSTTSPSILYDPPCRCLRICGLAAFATVACSLLIIIAAYTQADF